MNTRKYARAAVALTAIYGSSVMAQEAAAPSARYRFARMWEGTRPGPGAFVVPFGAAVDAGGNVFVADYGDSRIEKFDNNGKFLLAWGKLGQRPGEFWLPQRRRWIQAGTCSWRTH
jgi:hypothetical protein